MLANNPTFDSFVADMTKIIANHCDDEAKLLELGRARLAKLVATDSWLPEEFAQADDQSFKQYMLFRENGLDFSVISVVWAPGQKAIAHDHTVWGMIGQLRGSEMTQIYNTPEPGRPMTVRAAATLKPGETTFVSPTFGDIHDVKNVCDGVSVSIHVYGGDLEAVLGRRHRYKTDTGEAIPFETSYH